MVDDLDRGAPQDAQSVLARRSAYCTGVARLTVALLDALAIPAREVAGYVVDDLPQGGRSGFHRWIEVFYDDRGWVQVLPDPDEPIVHLYAEGDSEEGSLELEREIREIVEAIVQGAHAEERTTA